MSAVTTDYCSLQLVLSLLGPGDLAVCQAVCTHWREIATLPEVRGACLRRAWGVAQITANSSKEWSFLQVLIMQSWIRNVVLRGTTKRNPHILAIESISSFVRRHHLLPGESLQAIAVRQGGDLTALKRLNSIISDYSLSCRSFIYVPGIKSLDELRGKALRYEYDHVSKRGQAVVLDSQEEDQASSSKVSEEASASAEAVQPSAAQQAQILNKMSALLAKSLHIDEGAARYYIEEAGGDIKRAVLLARNDDSWATGAETPTSSRSGLQSRLRRILMLSGGGPAT
ncbi:hypothetical protein CEUSTIGMA_g1400.t1 [Chlamydomonas eustigma]|uniref:LysM domain-containing protein n=1 Tax=Chlamydomonas eustigma TaxID=1157962 RepID=A0A250WTS5_9CHLO|nr:hypothetical protein CEUSTIGMA_g1400.t1 [Chlamydomonas eustigma]|eukprot:GAX73950.1 hypothetical protein CEUSTIGMA_g1400.t1 [Chlamydomonas eustigma]